MKRIFGISLFLIVSLGISAQELFLNTEPASNVPKGVFGLKVLSETYNEVGTIRNQFSARLMYGLTPKLTVWAQPMLSNHHGKSFPSDLFNHSHATGSSAAQQISYGKKYKYLFSGLHLYAKYRVLTLDQDDSHFRLALYGETTPFGQQAHDEAEANLQGDNTGFGFGTIATYLKSRFAVSFTGGYIVPNSKLDKSTNNTWLFEYGNAINYSLSFGYLIYPKSYDSYAQNNYNIYLELMGRAYPDANIQWFDEKLTLESSALIGNQYLDAYVGIQRIVNSNDRIELSIGFPVWKKSYRHFYPVLNLGWQKYFYAK